MFMHTQDTSVRKTNGHWTLARNGNRLQGRSIEQVQSNILKEGRGTCDMQQQNSAWKNNQSVVGCSESRVKSYTHIHQYKQSCNA